MGSGRDKRKKSKGKTPGQGEQKTAKKTERNESKAERRAVKGIEGGEDDLDALLKHFQLQDKKAKAIEIHKNADPPSARLFANFTPIHGAKDSIDILLFGGEYYDGKNDKMRVYNGIYVYHPDKGNWTQIVSANGPAPRSAHQALVHKKYLYIFGGELTSPNQEKFKHYKDLWRLNLEDWSWEQLPGKGGPSARSGHRMLVHKNRIVLFGGFHDGGKATEYFNDLWVYDLEEMEWRCVGKTGATGPSPRGGCQLALHGDKLFLYSGHTVVVDKADKTETDLVHDDLWSLDLGTFTWERLKKTGMAPTKRASFGMVTYCDRAYLFGGVSDRSGAGDKMYSELHDELYQLDLSSQRWRPVAMKLRKAAKTAKADAQTESASDGSSMAPDPAEQSGVLKPDMQAHLSAGRPDTSSAIYKAVVRIQSRYRGFAVRKAYQTYKLGGKISELLYSPAAFGIDLSSKDMPKPRARANPMMAVCGNTLWLLGGVVEIAHTDVTLDDIWSLDLAKLNGWQSVSENTAGEDAFKDEDGWETDDSAKEATEEVQD